MFSEAFINCGEEGIPQQLSSWWREGVAEAIHIMANQEAVRA